MIQKPDLLLYSELWGDPWRTRVHRQGYEAGLIDSVALRIRLKCH